MAARMIAEERMKGSIDQVERERRRARDRERGAEGGRGREGRRGDAFWSWRDVT